MRKALIALVLAAMICIAGSPAEAYQYPGNISNLGNMVGSAGTLYTGELSGMFQATGVGYEAAYYNKFWGGTFTIFESGDTPDGVWSSAFNWNTALFTSNNGTNSIDHIQVYRLNETWTVQGANPISFEAGTYIIGYGDGTGDSDYDDLIIAARSVPIPGGIWLFAAGVLGIAGIRKKLGS